MLFSNKRLLINKLFNRFDVYSILCNPGSPLGFRLLYNIKYLVMRRMHIEKSLLFFIPVPTSQVVKNPFLIFGRFAEVKSENYLVVDSQFFIKMFSVCRL